MGKAFTKQERIEVQERLRRVGLRLFAEQGIHKVSIRELTKEVGIAQGGFYTFYKDKDEFLLDLICLRIREKLKLAGEKMMDTKKQEERREKIMSDGRKIHFKF